ncbi:hypothetical protein PCK2_000267, partial [Pneumocystis canis]
YLLRNEKWLSIRFLLYTYFFGATANQNLFLAIHELSHNLVFKNTKFNQYFSIFANFPIGVPYSALFKPYHLLHHKYLGEDGTDTDLPTKLEAILFNNVLGKAFFCTFQLLFYALRPILLKQLPFTFFHISNLLLQLLFDIILIRLAGIGALFYLILSSFLAGSLHPCAGHFISEHFSLVKDPDEAVDTFSYYGILNILTYNVAQENSKPSKTSQNLHTYNGLMDNFSNIQNTYAKQRSFIAEPIEDIEQFFSYSSYNITSKSQLNDEPNSEDSEPSNLNIKSIHELRESGISRKSLDEIQYLIDGLNKCNTLKLRQSCYIDLAKKMIELEFSRNFRSRNFSHQLLENSEKDTDIVLDYLQKK